MASGMKGGAAAKLNAVGVVGARLGGLVRTVCVALVDRRNFALAELGRAGVDRGTGRFLFKSWIWKENEKQKRPKDRLEVKKNAKRNQHLFKFRFMSMQVPR